MRTKALKRTLTRIHNYLTINALQVYRGGGGGGDKVKKKEKPKQNKERKE